MRAKVTFTHLALIFSVLGILLLYGLSFLSRPGEIPLSELSEHEGETVVIRGVVCRYYTTGRDETVIKICGEGVIVTAVIEIGDCSVELGDIIQLTGKVVRMSGEAQLQVARSTFVKSKGSATEELVPLHNVAAMEGEYVQTRAVVSDIERRDTSMELSIFDPGSGAENTLVVYERDMNVSIGAEINFSAYVDAGKNGITLRSFMGEAVAVEGFWESKELGIRRLFESISTNRREFMYFPVNVTGYVLYQPNPIFSGFTISDRTALGGRYIKVNLEYGTDIGMLDRGDLVKVRGKLTEDEKNMGLELSALFFEVLEEAQEENVSVEELIDTPFLYENANIRLTGSVCRSDTEGVLKGNNNYTLPGYCWMDAEGNETLPLAILEKDSAAISISDLLNRSCTEGDEITLNGKLVYITFALRYVFAMDEICAG